MWWEISIIFTPKERVSEGVNTPLQAVEAFKEINLQCDACARHLGNLAEIPADRRRFSVHLMPKIIHKLIILL